LLSMQQQHLCVNEKNNFVQPMRLFLKFGAVVSSIGTSFLHLCAIWMLWVLLGTQILGMSLKQDNSCAMQHFITDASVSNWLHACMRYQQVKSFKLFWWWSVIMSLFDLSWCKMTFGSPQQLLVLWCCQNQMCENLKPFCSSVKNLPQKNLACSLPFSFVLRSGIEPTCYPMKLNTFGQHLKNVFLLSRTWITKLKQDPVNSTWCMVVKVVVAIRENERQLTPKTQITQKLWDANKIASIEQNW